MDCTIIVFHYESFEFLLGCIRQLRKFRHPEIKQNIIIADQSGVWTHRKVNYTFSKDEDIVIVRIPQIDSGYSVDWVFRNMDIETKYFCTLDCDAFPIHRNWLYLPVKLIQSKGFSFVGGHAEIDDSYKEHGDLFIMNQFYRVGETETYKALSLHAGFVRYEDRILTKFNYSDKEWSGYADCGVVAHWYEDRKLKYNKLGLAKNKYIGFSDAQKIGITVDDLVFHFGQSNNTKNVVDKEKIGDKYLFYYNSIMSDGLTNGIIKTLLTDSQINGTAKPSTIWDGAAGKVKPASQELNNEIQKLKNS